MFNLSQVEAQNYELLPSGEYATVITGAEVKDSQAGGQYLKVELTITGPSQKGRKIFDIFNTKNSNPQAVQIGLGKLKTMSLACGLTEQQLTNFLPAMLSGKTLTVKTVIKKDKKGEDQVSVSKYAPTKTGAAIANAAAAFGATAEVIPF